MPQTEKIQIPVEVIDKASKSLNQINKELSDTGKGTDKMSAGMGKASMSLTDMNSAVQLAKQGLQALKQVYDFGKEGAAIERMGEASAEVFRQMGGNVDVAVEKIQAASLNTISEYDAMAAASRAAMLGVSADAEQLAELMQIAAFRGRAMGVSTTQAFNDIVTGIGRASPLILDNLGIITKGWADEASAAGDAYDAQFILNKVLEQGGAQLEEAGGLVEDTATTFEQFEAIVKDNTNALKQFVGEGIEPVIKNFVELNHLQERYSDAVKVTGDNINLHSRSQANTNTVMQHTINVYDELIEAAASADRALMNFDYTVEEMGGTVEMSAEQLEQMTKANQKWLDTVASVSKEYDSQGKKLADLDKKHADLLREKQALIDQGWSEESDKINDVNEKIDENREKYAEYTEDFILNSSRRKLALIEENLSADGLTEEETRRLEALGVAWGVYTEETIRQLQREREEAELLASAIMKIPTEWTTDIRINTIGSVPRFAGMEQGFRVSSGRGYASGTNGWETVPSGYPNDSYGVGLSSGERFAVVPAGQSAPAASGMSRDDLDYLIRGIKTAMQSVR